MLPFVVDTNVLFAFFWEESTARKFIARPEFKLYSPEYALEEINRYSSRITQKAGISPKKFRELKTELVQIVEFIPLEEYESFLSRALEMPDKDDIDFFALALKLHIPLWSNDKMLKEQKLITVLSTEDIVNLFSLF